jgi:N-acyl-D-amino-acid deacylase
MRHWAVSHICLAVILSLAVATAAYSADRFPSRDWQRAASPSDAGWSKQKLALAREFSNKLDTAAVMIVHDGLVIDEWGATALPLRCHSVRKSLLSALYGRHVAAGTIDLDATLDELGIDDNEPSLTDAEKQAKVRDVISARSGVYHPALYETKAMAAARPKRGSHDPGTFWYYNNWDFNVACSLFENLTGRSLFEEFEDRLAGPLQMQDFVRKRHTQYVTGDDSVHPAYPFQLSTRDLARVGLLFLRGGKWKGEQLVPAAWVKESTKSYSQAGSSGGYGYMWWVTVAGRHYPGVSLPEGSFSARGYRGQYLLVVPAWDLVVVHRVNSFQKDTSVSKTDFGKLLSLILSARPAKRRSAAAIDLDRNTGSANADFDAILRGGHVIDGSGRKSFRADVAIRDGFIAEVGDLRDRTAMRSVNVEGRIVAPGFIDLHSHADRGLISSDPFRRSAPNLITQGITTVVVNQDGGGPTSILEQRRTMEKLGIGLNVVPLIGHGTVRRAVLGEDHRRPASTKEIGRMQQLIRKEMQQGAHGLSAGLEYVPGRWSTQREMESLVRVLAEFDGVYVVHERASGSSPMWFLPSRDPAEQPSMIDNLRELVDIAATTRVRTVATHIKARGVDFWGSSQRMVRMIETARAEGVPLFADQYPYNTSGSDGRIVLIPGWVFKSPGAKSPAVSLEAVLADPKSAAAVRRDIAFEIARRGGAKNILVLAHPDKRLIGKSLSEVSKLLATEPVEAAIQFQLKGDRKRPGGSRLRAFSMSEKDVELFAAQPWTATSSDAGIALPEDGPVHPRFYGAFPRKIRHYALDKGVITLEEAIRVSTSLPAKILRLNDRGLVQGRFRADLVVFDPKRIRDTADAFNPHSFSEGIDYVFQNGRVIVDSERPIGCLAGQVIQRK